MREIVLATEKSKDTIVELLNEVTLALHNKNINQWTYPWNAKEIEEDLKCKNTYILVKNHKILGTFSLKAVEDNSKIPAIKPNNLYLYRIAILPEYQGQSLGEHIINYACDFSRKLKKVLYLDCWAGNENLKNFYSRVGLNYCGDFVEEDYMVSVFKY